jgi:hypothetical protein
VLLLLSGTLPMSSGAVAVGRVRFDRDGMRVGELEIPRRMLSIGATAMMAAALKTTEALGTEPPVSVVAGDLGQGDGSRAVYRYLTEDAGGLGPSTLTLHYILPLRNEFLAFVEMLDYWAKRPFMIADAGALLIAKATRVCERFDLFTPDAGEMAFLADPDAGHPAYVKAALFEVDTTEVPGLIAQAYAGKNSPRYLLVKGPTDYVVDGGTIVGTVSQPNIPALEPIGGTGDTITGIVSALIAGGLDPVKASLAASRANRLAGELCAPTPATRVFEIVEQIGRALEVVLDGR